MANNREYSPIFHHAFALSKRYIFLTKRFSHLGDKQIDVSFAITQLPYYECEHSDNANALNYGLAFEVIDFFRLTQNQATEIYDEVLSAVKNWREVATKLGISRAKQLSKQDAFNV